MLPHLPRRQKYIAKDFRMIKYTEIKPILTESLLENFPQAEGDEIEATVTHWLQ
jgi:hypothetical protein